MFRGRVGGVSLALNVGSPGPARAGDVSADDGSPRPALHAPPRGAGGGGPREHSQRAVEIRALRLAPTLRERAACDTRFVSSPSSRRRARPPRAPRSQTSPRPQPTRPARMRSCSGGSRANASRSGWTRCAPTARSGIADHLVTQLLPYSPDEVVVEVRPARVRVGRDHHDSLGARPGCTGGRSPPAGGWHGVGRPDREPPDGTVRHRSRPLSVR